MNVFLFAHRHRRALFTLLALLLALGGRAVFTSSRSLYPDVAFPRIAVIAERGEQPVRAMLVAITRPIEQATATVPGLARVRSKTVRGASELSLDFRPETDMAEALALVRARIAAAGLPTDTGLVIERQTPAVFPVLSFNVLPGPQAAADPVRRARLAEWCETDLKPRLARLPDAFMVTVQSGDRREYVFEADPTALVRTGVGLEDIKAALAEANDVASVGRSSADGLQYQLLVDGRLTAAAQVAEVAVARAGKTPVRLADLGRLVETVAEATTIVTAGGTDGVVVSLFLRDGGKVTELSRATAEVVASVRGVAPDGATIVPVYDQATLVDESIRGVGDAIALGALLSVVVLMLFLGDLRITFVAGLSIPISVALTLAVFPACGESLNLMTLGGLAVAIGLIIDDAIVVTENVARRLALKSDDGGSVGAFSAVVRGVHEVAGAVIGSSLTTVVVFLPLVLLEGVVGQFFRSLSFALGVSIVASTVVSLVWTPLLLLLPGLAPKGGLRTRRWMTALQDGYAAFVAGTLRRPWFAAILLLAVLAVGAVFARGVGSGFLPEMDEGGFVLDYALPVGTSLRETDLVCRKIERILIETPEVAALSRRTGAELGFFATEQFTGDMLVSLKPRESGRRSVFAVLAELRSRLAREVPQAEVEFIQVMQDTIGDLAGNPSAIEVKFFGSDYAELQRAADAAALAMAKVAGVVDVKSGVSFGSPELTWRPDSYRAARFGLSTKSIAEQTGLQLLGGEATKLQEGDRFVDVRVRMPAGARFEDAVDGTGPPLFVLGASADGTRIPTPLADIASFSRSLNENELERENQTPMVRVTAAVEGRDLGSAAKAVESAVAVLPKPSGVRIEFGGQAAGRAEAFQNLLLVAALGGGLVLLLLVAQFRSFRLPLVMLSALPFGVVGGLMALRFFGVALNVGSGMGLVMLVGLAVKNGIILIERAQQACAEGRSPHEATLDAARARLRPILMTTTAAIVGLLPLALGVGAGAELQRPLAITVIGGLVMSTLATLVVVPLGCATFARSRLLPETAHAV